MLRKFHVRNVYSVVGLGYGDEGKGTVVDYLASHNPYSIVVRHSGGHQVGHTVKIGNKLHEFRHFGSGTFRNIPTIWERRCTVSPLQFQIEYNQIVSNFAITPSFYCDNFCPVTTLYDIAYNRAKERQYKDGSTGVGFGATLIRHDLVPLFAMDLGYAFVLKEKLKNISDYYFKKTMNEGIDTLYADEISKLASTGYAYDLFVQSCQFFMDHTKRIGDVKTNDFDTAIFEGNQGVLLDKAHGFFPNVTYGYTTNRKVKSDSINSFYVSRCYGTRHGFGPLLNENLDAPILINNEFEQNHLNPWQDNFRTAILDFNLVEYAIKCDQSYDKNETSSLVMTCMDQIEKPKMTYDGVVVDFDLDFFKPLVDFIYTNNSPESNTIKLWK